MERLFVELHIAFRDALLSSSDVGYRNFSGVARPKFFWGGAKFFILGDQQYFVWDTASQSTK